MSMYAVMLFDTEINLGISNEPGKWVNYKTLYTNNGAEALDWYANIKCPASQLIKATEYEELKREIEQMKNNYKDQNWLNKNLYPFL